MPTLDLRRDDLSGAATLALIGSHLAAMRDGSPAESCHALGVDELRDPTITLWSAWFDDTIAGIGAWKDLGDGQGELKSMRVADAFLGRGIGRAVLHRLVDDAREHGIVRLWLETGRGAEFAPARRLYESEGFAECPPFGSYHEDPLSVFMTRSLTARTPAG